MKESSLKDVSLHLIKQPSLAFHQLEGNGRAWFPLLVIVFINVCFLAIYYQLLDYNWALDRMVSVQTAEMSPAQTEQFRGQLESLGWNSIVGWSIGAVIAGVPVFYAIFSVYLLIVSNIREDDLRFGECFTITAWGNLVGVFSVLLGILQLPFYSNGQIPDSLSRGLNLNDLIFNLEPTHEYYGILSTLDPIYIWATVLTAIGYKVFTKSSFTASVIICFAPMIVITAIALYI